MALTFNKAAGRERTKMAHCYEVTVIQKVQRQTHVMAENEEDAMAEALVALSQMRLPDWLHVIQDDAEITIYESGRYPVETDEAGKLRQDYEGRC